MSHKEAKKIRREVNRSLEGNVAVIANRSIEEYIKTLNDEPLLKRAHAAMLVLVGRLS